MKTIRERTSMVVFAVMAMLVLSLLTVPNPANAQTPTPAVSGAAAFNPLWPAVGRRTDEPFVGGRSGLVDRPSCQRDAMQDPTALGLRWRNERPRWTDGLVEPIENGGGVDQGLAVVEHERWDTTERVDPAHGVEIREDRAGVVLVGEAQDT